MKNLKFLFLFFIIPFVSQSQSLSGIWTGVLSNDSLTIRKDQSFEMALTEYRGKVMGYAYSTFIVNDTLYYIVKRVKGEITGDICEVEDDDVVTHNFRKKPEKGVNVIYTFRRSGNDSAWTLDGNWKTNATKKYYAISGNVKAKEEKDLARSKLYEHLGDLNLQKTLAFNEPKETEKKTTKVKEDKKDIAKVEVKNPEVIVSAPPKQDVKTDIVKTEAKPVNNKPIADIAKAEMKKPDALVSNAPKQEEKTGIVKTETKPVDNKPNTEVSKIENKRPDALVSVPPKQEVKTDIVKTEQKTIVSKPVPLNTNTENKKPDALVSVPPKQEVKTDVVKTEQKTIVSKPVPLNTNSENKKPDALVSVPPKQEVKTDIVKTEQKPVDNKPVTNNASPKAIGAEENKSNPEFVFSDLKRTNKKLKPASAMLEGRESVPSETIFYKSDSLVLALYDNGEVDGDTVSVILNGELIIEKQGLKSAAFKKTIYLSPDDGDSVLLVLYAENLGIYPPNTGLLIVRDGEESYYVRFKADYDRNAAIMLRKKLK